MPAIHLSQIRTPRPFTMLAVVLAAGVATNDALAQFTALYPSTGVGYLSIRSISDDGSGVVGTYFQSNTLPNTRRAFVYSQVDGGVIYNHPTDPQPSGLGAISGDGTRVSGFENPWNLNPTGTTFTTTDFRTQRTLIPSIPGRNNLQILKLSQNGSVVVGTASVRNDPQNTTDAYRWVEGSGVPEALGRITPFDSFVRPNGMNADGTVIVGEAANVAQTNGFVWRQGVGMQALTPLNVFDAVGSSGNDVSSDGSVIAGLTIISGVGAALPTVWTNGVATQLPLGQLADGGNVLSVNHDGSVMFGLVQYSGGPTFTQNWCVWVNGATPVYLVDYLAANGATLPQGFVLNQSATFGMSKDGRTFFGFGNDTNGRFVSFIATIPSPSCITVLSIAPILNRRRRLGCA